MLGLIIVIICMLYVICDSDEGSAQVDGV
jgi:hypothetical protein